MDYNANDTLYSAILPTVYQSHVFTGVVSLPLIDPNDIVCIEETAVTVRSYRRRTTVPSKIFKLLNIHQGDALRWVALKDGTVYITKVRAMHVIDDEDDDEPE